jgi:RHS repeat-associated protein
VTTSRCLVLALAIPILAAPLASQQHPNLERGFSPEKSYQFGGVDGINLGNGNVALTIPLSIPFPVGGPGALSYQLRASFNSKVFDIESRVDSGTGTTYTQAVPNRRSSAGLGWIVSLGRLIPPSDVTNETGGQFVYESEDGGDHVFYDRRQEGDTPVPDVFFTRGSEYFRLKKVGTDREVESGDGTIRRFDLNFRLTQIRDRFGNALNVTYSTNGLVWTLTDTTNRVHTITFQQLLSDNQFINVVDKIEFAAFGPTAALWDFTYAPTTIQRSGAPGFPCLDNDPTTADTVGVPLLTTITLPDLSTYQFTYYQSDSNNACKAGTLQRMTLPTKGIWEWDYARYPLPAAGCVNLAAPAFAYESQSPGVVLRRMIDANGTTELGRWTYTPTIERPAPTAACPDAVTQAPPGEVLKQVVQTPLLDKTVHYFSTWPNVGISPNGFDRKDMGLPFTRKATDGSTPARYLSSEVQDCDTAGANCVTRRQQFVRYENDLVCPAGSLLLNCVQRNRRLQSSRTVFLDDSSRFKQIDLSNFDGFGHYRQTDFVANYDAANSRTTVVNFTPIATTTTWLLETFTDVTTTAAGGTEKREFSFNQTTGFLERMRALKSGATRGTHDQVARFTAENGNRILEEYFGGDNQSLGTGDLVSLSLAAPEIVIQRVWQDAGAGLPYCGVPRKTRFLKNGASIGFESEDYDINCRTGLPSASRDTAGLQTSFEYDEMGRVTFVKPAAGHGSWTEVQYTRATAANALAKAVILQRPNGGGTALAESVLKFDAFGRVGEEQRRSAAGSLVGRTLTYNAMGWRDTISEMGVTGTTTSYQLYDAFGRPGRIRPPDGNAHDVLFSYLGDREMTRRVSIGTAWTGSAVTESLASTVETYDAEGRLFSVREPSGPSGGDVTTTYTRDVGGRVAAASTSSSGTTQVRSFGYDNLGLLAWETHPEKTTNSAGLGHDVDYPAYNAVGNVLRRVDGTNDLTLVYDEALRLTLIRETSGGQRALKEFAYAASNGAGERSLGKLRTATRHNRFNICGSGGAHDAAIEETYTYAGIGGGVSKRATRLVYDNVAGEAFEQTFSWTALGQPNSVGYPRCTTCTGPASVTRNVSYGYSNGWVTSVPGYANAISYLDSGLWNQITHSNSVIDTQTPDPTFMPRPLSISSALGATTLWTTGAYGFDGAGNVTRTSAGHYIYDSVSRLKEGQIYLFFGGGSGGTLIQRPAYDAFGNIQSISLQANTDPPVPRDLTTNSATNRLTGTGVAYDAAGNLTTWSGKTFEYDPFNQVSRVTVPGEDWLHFYTADDERIWSYRLGATTINRWTLRDLGRNVLREFVSDSAGWRVERDYIYRDGALLASETPQGVRHLHIDHLGTPRTITDAAGTRLAYHIYLPFGEEGTGFNQDSERAKFTGHERDLHSTTDASDDLDHMHARQYSMLGGRFLSTDWVGGSLRRPQSLNRYAYVLGNPMTYWDPTGLDPEPPPPHEETITVVGALPPPLDSAVSGIPWLWGIFGNVADNPLRWTVREPQVRLQPFDDPAVQRFFACVGRKGSWGQGPSALEAAGVGVPSGSSWLFSAKVGERGRVKFGLPRSAAFVVHTHPFSDIGGPSANDRFAADSSKNALIFYVIHARTGVTSYRKGDPPSGLLAATPGWEEQFKGDVCEGVGPLD